MGDRSIESQDLSALEGDRKWDWVIDTWPADPRMIERTASILKGRVGGYAFISSIAVYADKTKVGITEEAPLHDVAEFKPGMSYYESKVLCEEAVKSFFPTNHLITRPPGIHGRRDESWTLVYWLWRIRKGGTVMAPGDGNDPIQYVDAADVARYMVHALETKQTGIFNTMGPRTEPLKWVEFLTRINDHYGGKANFVQVDWEFLDRKKLRPVVDIPMWEPRHMRAGRHTMSAEKAIQSGLTFTRMEETFDRALNWYDEFKGPGSDPGLDQNRPFNGITRERELEILREWTG